MRKTIQHYLLLLTLFLCYTFSTNAKPFDKKEGYLVVMHPTIANIEWVETLIKSEIIDIDSYQILGVYEEHAQYNYEKTRDYIRQKKLDNIVLKGIDCEYNVDQLYQNTHIRKIVESVTKYAYGYIFNGGPDIPAKFYGETQSTLTVVTDPYRHFLEIEFLAHLLGSSNATNSKPLLDQYKHLPVLGICLGMQTMNVATGGTLFQDIPHELYHVNKVEDVIEQSVENRHKNYHVNRNRETDLFYSSFHQIKLLDHQIFPTPKNVTTPEVLSAHHQSLNTLGKDIVPIATSLDGKVIEAIGHNQYPMVIGLQFHPERTFLYKSERFQFSPNEMINPYERIKTNGSLDFHLEIWQVFSAWVKGYKVQMF